MLMQVLLPPALSQWLSCMGPKAWHDMVGHSMHAPDKTVASCR